MHLHIIAFMRHAVVHYGYWAVGAVLLLENIGLPLPGETVLLFASFLAYDEHELQLSWIIIVATLVSTLGGSLGFALGKNGGRPMLDRYQRLFRIRFGGVTVFFSRFVFGLRVIAGPLAGVLRMPARKFLVWNFIGAAAWVTVVTMIGYFFGRHWKEMERVMKRFDIAVVVAALIGLAVWWWRRRQRVVAG
jgi:membrane protein DedA with SNARE-associated domain